MKIERTRVWPTKDWIEYKKQVFSKKKKDKYKDPTNDRILKEISKKIDQFKKEVVNDTDDKGLNLTKELFNFVKDVELKCFRIGCYAGMNITLKNLGKEPL